MLDRISRSFSLLPRQRGSARGYEIIILLGVLLCLSALTISWSAPSAGLSGASPSTKVYNVTAPEVPSVNVSPIYPGSLSFSQVFDINVALSNYGHATAQDVNLFYRAGPRGLIQILNIDQWSSAINTDEYQVSLDNIQPGDQAVANFRLQAPSREQTGVDWHQQIQIDFIVRYFGSPAVNAGSIIFKMQYGRLVLSQQGFSQ